MQALQMRAAGVQDEDGPRVALLLLCAPSRFGLADIRVQKWCRRTHRNREAVPEQRASHQDAPALVPERTVPGMMQIPYRDIRERLKGR